MKTNNHNLLSWYKKENYQMPWRGTKNPYKIWISEVMLQQTQVNTVKNYFNKWMEAFPTINDVALASNEKILKTWEGLGYYKRAHNIHETAQYLVEQNNGYVPDTYDDLIKLKGIGDYTASAILSIAFQKPYPAIDGNLRRIISRLYVVNGKQLEKNIKNKISLFIKDQNPGDVIQAFMDLGREVCLSQNPLCTVCPLSNVCVAYQTNQTGRYPKKITRKTLPHYEVIVGFIKKDNKILISKRKKEGLLGGLWELPGGKKNNNENNKECLLREIKEELDIHVEIINKIGSIKHQYSHFKINLTGYHCIYKTGKVKPLSSEEIKWITFNKINDFAFPKSTIKLLSLIKGII